MFLEAPGRPQFDFSSWSYHIDEHSHVKYIIGIPKAMQTVSRLSHEDAPGTRVMRSLRELIDDGTFGPGQALPSERALAERFGVARTTVRDALNKIAAEGLVSSNGGRLRIVNGSGNARPGVLANTIVLLNANPHGAVREHTVFGWEDWIDQGAMDEVRRRGLHHLAFNPLMLHGGDWDEILAAKPFGIVVRGLLDRLPEAKLFLEKARDRGVPLVVYGIEDDLVGVDRVASDHAQGVYDEVKWLYQQGRRRVLMMGCHRKVQWFQDRWSGYERAVREFGLELLPVMPDPAFPGLDPAGEIEVRSRLLAGYLVDYLNGSPPVDAILCPSDGEMPRVQAACRILGKAPGTDVLLAGYDNYWAETEVRHHFTIRPAVTVDKDNRRIGAELVRLISERVAGTLPDEPQCRFVAPAIVIAGETRE